MAPLESYGRAPFGGILGSWKASWRFKKGMELDPGRRVGRRVNPPSEVGELWKSLFTYSKPPDARGWWD